MKVCPHMSDALIWYAADELDASQRQDVETHLAGCEPCRQELLRLEKITAIAALGDPRPAQPALPVGERRRRLMAGLAGRQRYRRLRLWPFRPRASAGQSGAGGAGEHAAGTGMPPPSRSRPLMPGRGATPAMWGPPGEGAWRPLFLTAILLLFLGAGYYLGRLSAGRAQADPTLQTLLTGYPADGAADQAVQKQLLDVHRVRYDPRSGQVEIEYNTVHDVRFRGSGDLPQAQQMLAQAMRESDETGLRLRAVKAAGGIAARGGSLDPDLLESVQYLLHEEQNQGVRLAALRVLRLLPVNETVKETLLRILLYDKNTALRIEALEGLTTKWGRTGIEPWLHSVAKDSSSYLRYKAAQLLREPEAEPVQTAELSKEE